MLRKGAGREFFGASLSRFPMECADMSALWNWQTCLPVGKRRHVAALQMFRRYFVTGEIRSVIVPSEILSSSVMATW
jgi:hypothetical protein